MVVVTLLGLYALAWRRFGGGPGGARATLSRGRVALYLSGVATIYAASGTPLHELAENHLYSAHMAQHMLLTLVAPPLLVAGTPGWMLRPLLRGRRVFAIAGFLTQPLLALALFNALIVVTHLPVVVDMTLRNHLAHLAAHAALVSSALLLWWQIYSPLPELPPLRDPWRLGYLFLQSILPTVPASFLTFADGPLYGFYAELPRLWGVSVATDQQMAGLIMKLGGGLLLWAIITVLFFRWYEGEEAEAIGLPSWEKAEMELERMGLTKR